MALTSVVSATLMKGQSEEFGVAVVLGVLLLGLLLGAINGGLVVVTRVPDIVVTLAMSFVWAGVALLVLKTPGGGAAEWLKDLVIGSLGERVDPQGRGRPDRRRRRDLDPAPAIARSACRSTPSAATGWPRSAAACRSAGRKIVAYTLTGLFAALGGLGLTASTGIGTPVPGPYTLLSVAAIVLGGVSLAGGRGGVFGPIVAVIILQLIRTDMTFLNVNTNLAVGPPGRHPHRRGHGRQPDPDPAEPGMSGTADRDTRSPWLTAGGLARLFRDRPLIPLHRPARPPRRCCSSSSARASSGRAGPATIVRAAIPLAILAGCQTLTMLTGGIDLSVGAVASMAGFVVATLVGGQGLAVALVVALVVAALAGARHRHRRRRLQVHPLIMTLGMGLVVLGLANVWQLADGPDRRRRAAPSCERSGRARFLGILPNSLLVFVPVAALILFGLRRTGYGRLLYAIGDNPIAARLSGARSWQVLIVLYVISALLAAIAGFLHLGPDQRRERDPRRRTCCRRSPPRSSAGRRSWAAAAATAGRSSAR